MPAYQPIIRKYSTENQARVIRHYAQPAGSRLSASMRTRGRGEEGKSGLGIDRRDALKQLINDVQAGTTDFTMVLAYDVSRWG